ncbi:unnamed protein product [Withania somnifera]
MDFQQPHPYNRPPPQPPLPPSSMADHHYQLPHSQRPPVPSPGSWYSNQFQYHPPPQQSPPPPPPQPQKWGPPPPPPPPFPGPPQGHYPPHHIQQQAQHPPPLPPRPHVSQSSPHGNQDWGSMNWGQQQSWGNSVSHSNEDWAAKARAWAASKAASDHQHQHQHSQFTHDSRPEQQSHYYEQYTQPADQHLQDMQQPPLLPSNNQRSMTTVAPPQRASFGHSQDPSFFSSGQSPHVLPYTTRNGNFTGDSVASFLHQGNSSISPSVHQQEVPSSYSSVTGKEEAGNQHEAFYGSSPLSANSSQQQHAQLMPAPNKAVVMEECHYVMGPDLGDQSLDFAPHFNHEHDRQPQPYYVCADSGVSLGGADPVSAMPSNYTWPSGAAYPPLPPMPPVDPSVVGASPAPEHTAPLTGRAHSSNFHPTVPSVGAHFGVGAGPSLHPAAAFPADAYGISDRPKKAAVPNWLRDEIIKKKAVITTSAPELPKEDSQSIEDEGVNKSYRKGDQADSKSIDSSRSTEEEDDDEDEVEAARTAAMNKEIKRVLTEVLLKVTDGLFNEIAMRVLSEEDLTVDVEQENGGNSQKVLASVQAVTTPKPSAKILVPLKPKDAHSVIASEKSTSTSPGDLLGLANYASDDEDDNEIQSSDEQKPKEHDSGKSREESEEHDRSPASLEKNPHRLSPNVGTDDRSTRYSAHEDAGGSSKTESRVSEDKLPGVKDVVKTEKPSQTLDFKKTMIGNSRSKDSRDKPDKSSKSEARKGLDTNDNGMYITSSKGKKPEIEEVNRGNHEEIHTRKEKVDDLDGSKDILKDKSHKSGERAKESNSRKRPSPSNVKEERKEIEKGRRAGVITDNGRKRERAKDEKREKSRRKYERGSSRRRRHRSSSNDSRGRESKDRSTRTNDPSDESSDDSRRKVQSNRRRSPSPLSARKRHASRSPHSKHSQRRHSPYPASESIRGRRSRSRSRSPNRRKR